MKTKKPEAQGKTPPPKNASGSQMFSAEPQQFSGSMAKLPPTVSTSEAKQALPEAPEATVNLAAAYTCAFYGLLTEWSLLTVASQISH